jgi:hypothetical protein
MTTKLCDDVLNIIYRYIHELNMMDVHRVLILKNLMKEYHNPHLGYTMDYDLCNSMEPIISFNYNNNYYKLNGIYNIIKAMIANGLNINHKINDISIAMYIENNMNIVNRNDKFTINDRNKTLLLLSESFCKDII